MNKQKSVRLPAHIIPHRYEITLKPDLQKFVFDGEEIIDIEILRPTKTITLHASELSIPEIFVQTEKEKIKGKIKFEPKSETVTFTFSKQILKGKGKLHIVFKGVLNDKLRGFYRSKYMQKGEEKYLATTQFEATDARRAFPCFDEPALKAIFDVKLIIPKHLTAISNTLDETVEEHDGGFKAVRFSESPRMSTYLLAFIVGDFEYIETKTKEGVGIRVFVQPGKKKQAEFALTVASKVLSFYTYYFKVAYPMPNLDLIAIPDFAAGAMENWGAVTYRESTLLIDEKNSSTANKQWVALVVAHELAHMWFGNLVTMEWWTHLWLNEGFASYIEYLAIDSVFPEWDIWTQFVGMEVGTALKLDGLANTHPIEVEVHHPDEIGEIFDKVSYSKGASIIRMLSLYLGETTFRDGLRFYLSKYAYKNAKTDDLWKSFEHVSKKDIPTLMKNWTRKPGYPLLSVVQQNNKLTISQMRFFSSPLSKKTVKDTTVWQIPLLVAEGNKISKDLMLQEKIVIKTKSPDFVKVNANQAGVVRVLYDQVMLQNLEEAIKKGKVATVDRLGIIRDGFDLSQSADLSSAKALELSLSYKKETDFTVWTQIISGVAQIDAIFSEEKFYPHFKKYGIDLLRDVVSFVGFEKKKNEKHTTALLRGMVLYYNGKFGDKKTIEKAKKMFEQQEKKKILIDPDSRTFVYCLIAQYGGEKEVGKLQQMYRKEPLQQEKDRIAKALCQFEDEKILEKTLAWSLSSEVRSQDSIRILAEVISNPFGREIGWEFIKKNFDTYVMRYSGGGHMFSRFVGILGEYTTDEKAREIESFFRKKNMQEAKRTLQQVLEQIRSNALWRERDKNPLSEFLSFYSEMLSDNPA